MLEESIPAIWASMNSWFTPTVLFVVLNLMIGTIAVASGIGNPKHDHHQQQQQQQQTQNEEQQNKLHPQLVRSPSVLQRIKSFNLHRFRSEDNNPFSSVAANLFHHPQPEVHQTQTNPTQIETQTHELPETHDAEAETESFAEESLDKVFEHHVLRTKSETIPASGDMPVKLPKKMKKSASTKSAFAHFEEEQIVELQQPRPSTVRERKKTDSDVQPFGDDEEVDAKADDFINRFKQQLKLQRLDSILRYKEMLNRG